MSRALGATNGEEIVSNAENGKTELKYAIFDMDGTLIDSMSYWYRAIYDYLLDQGAEMTPEFERLMKAMSFPETMDYCRNVLHMRMDAAEVARAVDDRMVYYYATEIQTKPGVRELLADMKAAGRRMCVVTATRTEMSLPVLERLGLLPYFEFVMDCQDFPDRKNTDAVYLAAAERFGCRPEEAVIFEDSPHAIETAGRSAFRLVAVKDPVAKDYEAEIRALADVYAEDLADPAVREFLGLPAGER